MSTSGYCNSFPEAPNSVTINQTVLELDGSTAYHYADICTIANGLITLDADSAYKHIDLSYYPVSPGSLTLYKNGVAQRNSATLDYTLVGKTVVLVDAAVASDTFMAVYFTAAEVASSTMEVPVGTVMGYDWGTDLANVPAGWVALDGVSSLSQTTYATLYAWVSATATRIAAYRLSVTGTTSFILKAVNITASGGTTSLQGIIKY